MTYQQRCVCIGAREVLTRWIDRETSEVVALTIRAARLERRKERPHRLAQLIEQAITLRLEAAQHAQDAKRLIDRLALIPTTAGCSVCAGRGYVQASGTIAGHA